LAAICLLFELHQPYRLRRYSVTDTSTNYFDDANNREILQRVAIKCYEPTTRMMIELVRKHEGRYRFTISITGTLLDQLANYAPHVIDTLRELLDTGCVELLSETYYHSLAFFFSHDEFLAQIAMHDDLVEKLFGIRPCVFRNTELTYNNDLARSIAAMNRFKGIIAEGTDRDLGERSAAHLYKPPGDLDLAILLKHYRLSDDIAFRFSDRTWDRWPLTADKYARWIERLKGDPEVIGLHMDYEVIGEHQWAETGIFEFFRALPTEVLRTGHDRFLTASEAIDEYQPAGIYDVVDAISMADTERDLSAWLGNTMQCSAMAELYRLEAKIKATGDTTLLRDWRRLTTSDHFYYMSTKYFSDGDVHQYFNPYKSPYDSYINYMTVLERLASRANRS